MSGMQTSQQPDIILSSVCPQQLLTHFSFPFLYLLCPRNQKTRRGKSVLRPNHTPWPNLSTNSGRLPTSVASPCSACQAHSILTTDSSCRRKCPPIANSSEVHSLAGGSFQQMAWEGKN